MPNLHRLAAAALLALLLSGCAVFTKPTGQITIERQEFVNAWAMAKAIYLRHIEYLAQGCRQGAIPEAKCAALEKSHEAAKRLALEVDAKLAVPESEINWAAVMKMLEFTAGLVL